MMYRMYIMMPSFDAGLLHANPHTAALNFYMLKYYGDQAELEHKHVIKGQLGAIKFPD